MITVVNKRIEEVESGGFGVWSVGAWSCFSLERSFLNNLNNISSIPLGEYECRWTFSIKYQRKMYEVLNVPGRAGVRIHAANEAKELEGCIALCLGMTIREVGGLYGSQSGLALDKFISITKKEPFLLKIVQLR